MCLSLLSLIQRTAVTSSRLYQLHLITTNSIIAIMKLLVLSSGYCSLCELTSVLGLALVELSHPLGGMIPLWKVKVLLFNRDRAVNQTDILQTSLLVLILSLFSCKSEKVCLKTPPIKHKSHPSHPSETVCRAVEENGTTPGQSLSDRKHHSVTLQAHQWTVFSSSIKQRAASQTASCQYPDNPTTSIF